MFTSGKHQFKHGTIRLSNSIKCYKIFFFLFVNRQNPRNYTHVVNNGVSRSENLQGFMSFADQYTYEMANMLLPDALIEEVKRVSNERENLLGLEECYKKVCKVSLNTNTK